MSKVAIQGNASGTGTFTIAAPNSNTDRTLTLPDEAGTVLTSGGAIDVNASAPADSLAIDSSGRVGINTSSPIDELQVVGNIRISTAAEEDNGLLDTDGFLTFQRVNATESNSPFITQASSDGDAQDLALGAHSGSGAIRFFTGASTSRTPFTGSNAERMRIDSSGNLLVGKTTNSISVAGAHMEQNGSVRATRDGAEPMFVNRLSNDGNLVNFYQDTVFEGSISVSGSTVSYNGGHLARWSRLADDSKDTSIVKGTVMTNLDAMVVWHHDAVEAQDAVYDEEGNLVSEAVEAKEAYTEDNEQLNKMAVSSVEGDPNVAGVFVNWDDDDDDFNDMNIAMTGDMVIRIAEGTTVQRGDLLMSAGDGTAKPQGDDIVRSKTIAKVTSTHVSHTYDDGSYLVPCVLMAC